MSKDAMHELMVGRKQDEQERGRQITDSTTKVNGRSFFLKIHKN